MRRATAPRAGGFAPPLPFPRFGPGVFTKGEPATRAGQVNVLACPALVAGASAPR
jgi:hypothetical protein